MEEKKSRESRSGLRGLQDATRYGFRDRDFFRKNDAVVVGKYHEVPVFRKGGKFFAAYLISACTDGSERNSCKITRGFGTQGEAERAAIRCSVSSFLGPEERLEAYKGYVITRQLREYVDDATERDGLLYSAATLVRRDLSGELDERLRHSMFVRHTPLMRSVEDVRAYIDGIKRPCVRQEAPCSVKRESASADTWER